MAAPEQFLHVAEIRHHGHDMVLHVAEVETDFATRGHAVGFVAAFGEALDDVRFAAEQTHEGHDFLAAVADLAEERGEVVRAGDEDLVFDGFGFGFDAVDGRAEGVDYVVEHGVADPVGREGHVVAEFADALADVGGVGGDGVSYGEDAGAEDDHVDVDGLHVVRMFRGYLVKGAEADEVVLFEELNFLACFLRDDIFGRQPMDTERALEDLKFIFRRVVDIKPPYTAAVGGKGKEFARSFSRTEKAGKIGGMYSLLKLRAEEAIASMLCKRRLAMERPFLAQRIHINVFNSIFVAYWNGAVVIGARGSDLQ